MQEAQNKPFFPIFLNLSEKHVLVVGAGKIAARRIRTLLDFAGKITVTAPQIEVEILSMAGKGPIQLRKKIFEESDRSPLQRKRDPGQCKS